MLKWLQECFEGQFGKDGNGLPDELQIHVATCALLLELCYVDGEFQDSEREAIVGIFAEDYGLGRDIIDEIIKQAMQERNASHDVYWFTKRIRDHYPKECQIRIVELMWKVVLADGQIDPHEDYLVAKLYDLLHVRHDEFIAAKLRALRGEV